VYHNCSYHQAGTGNNPDQAVRDQPGDQKNNSGKFDHKTGKEYPHNECFLLNSEKSLPCLPGIIHQPPSLATGNTGRTDTILLYTPLSHTYQTAPGSGAGSTSGLPPPKP
jgi:hypothetical protein